MPGRELLQSATKTHGIDLVGFAVLFLAAGKYFIVFKYYIKYF